MRAKFDCLCPRGPVRVPMRGRRANILSFVDYVIRAGKRKEQPCDAPRRLL